jgi:hypothetical protein
VLNYRKASLGTFLKEKVTIFWEENDYKFFLIEGRCLDCTFDAKKNQEKIGDLLPWGTWTIWRMEGMYKGEPPQSTWHLLGQLLLYSWQKEYFPPNSTLFLKYF